MHASSPASWEPTTVSNIPPWLNVAPVVILILLFWLAVVPLTGVLVRLRANYSPKGLRLADEDEVERAVQPVVGVAVASYCGMFARVYRLEGFSGLFKGIAPYFLFKTICNIIWRTTRYQGLSNIVLSILFIVPAMTLIYRAMTTPHKLSIFKPRASLRLLLSPHERANSLNLYSKALCIGWAFYFIASTTVIRVTHQAVAIILYALLKWAFGGSGQYPSNPFERNPEVWIIIGSVIVVGVIVLPPLDVVLVRLSVQRYHGLGGVEAGILGVENSDREDVDTVSVSNEEVIVTHPDQDPYLGLYGCVTRIVNEEGWKTLYRGWWVSLLLGGSLSAFI